MKHLKVCLFLTLIFIGLLAYSSPVGAIFIPQKQFDDVEFLITTSLLDSAGLTYYVFSENDDTCIGISGLKTLPFTTIDSTDNYPMDFLIINGGIGITYISENKKLHKIIADADSAGKVIVASNFAPILFMKIGMLRGREINFVRNNITQELVEKHDVKYKSEPVVVTENLITSPSSEFVRHYIGNFIRRMNEDSCSEGE
ncbi:MAG: DJ-1/PfpI family protein [bacterium]|nr:DJ-1/PfpI family protein [bacterium]